MPGRTITHQPTWNSHQESRIYEQLSKAAWFAIYRDLLAQTLGKDWCDITTSELELDCLNRLVALDRAGIYPRKD